MVNETELVNEFEFVGVKVSKDIINKCLEICAEYNLNAETLVEEWITYGTTKLNGNLDPTLYALDMMAKKQLITPEPTYVKEKPVEQVQKHITVYTNSASSDLKEIMDVYNIEAQKVTSNTQHPIKIQNTFSPASYNPSVGKKSLNYAERKDAGIVISTFGKEYEFTKPNAAQAQHVVSVRLFDEDKIWNASDVKYMFDVLKIEAEVLSERLRSVGEFMMKKNHLLNFNDGLKKTVYGRIRSEGDGRLNSVSIILEPTMYLPPIRISCISNCSVFPGQIVAVCGEKTRENFVPEQIYTDATPNLPVELPDIRTEKPLGIVVACGPFTLSENLMYEPLQDLVRYVQDQKPHILILIGPFVDIRHTCVSDGSLAVPFQSYFETLLDSVLSSLQSLKTQVVLVPSNSDAHHHPVYPTPPFETFTKRYNNLHLVSDPTILNLDGLILGATSIDILFQIARSELNLVSGEQDRMARFASHVLSQQSFYPLYPAVDKCVDQKLLLKYGSMPVLPHILILPSNFGHFVKNVKGCIVINPSKLSKGLDGGTFAHIDLYPGQTSQSVENNIRCSIIKI